MQRGLAWADVAGGRYDSARDRLLEAAAWAAAAGQAAPELLVRNDLVRLGDRSQAARIAELAALTVPSGDGFGAAAALAARARSGQDWDAAAEAYAALGARIEGMEAYAAAVAAFRAESEPRRAKASGARLAALAGSVRRCGPPDW